MMPRKKEIITVVFCFFITAGLLILSRDGFSLESNPEITVEKELQQTKGFFLTETEGGETKWDIRASSAEFLSGNLVVLKKVKINFYEKGKKVLTVKADSGHFNKVSQNLHLEKNITGVTSRGETFVTRSLDWISAEQKIETSDKIKIVGQNIIVNAQDLVFYPALNKMILKKNVRTEIYGENKLLPEDAPTIINAETLEIELNQNKAIFLGGVKVVQAHDFLEAKELQVIFDKEGGGIDKLIAKGEVKISQGNNIGLCEEAIYEFIPVQKVTLKGNSRLKRGKQKFSGETIIFLIDEQRAIIKEKVRGVMFPQKGQKGILPHF